MKCTKFTYPNYDNITVRGKQLREITMFNIVSLYENIKTTDWKKGNHELKIIYV